MTVTFQEINLGVIPSGEGGDDVRSGNAKTNENFQAAAAAFSSVDNSLIGMQAAISEAEQAVDAVAEQVATLDDKTETVLVEVSESDSDVEDSAIVYGWSPRRLFRIIKEAALGLSSFEPTSESIVTSDVNGKIHPDRVEYLQEMGTASNQTMSQQAITNAISNNVENYYQGAYGLTWDSVTASYIRTGAKGHTSIQSRMRRCLLLNGEVNYFLHPDNSNFKENGEIAVLDGGDGNVMVQIPKFYISNTEDDVLRKFSISLTPEAGYTVHPAFIKAGVEVDFRYYPAFRGRIIDGKLMSILGAVSTVSKTIDSFRIAAQANGVGYHLLDFALMDAVRLLAVIEFGTFLVKPILGNGQQTGTAYSRASGLSLLDGNNSTVAPQNTYMSYRGIEDLYGVSRIFTDGINVLDREVFINLDYRTFASNVFSGDYVSTGVMLPVGEGYSKDVAVTSLGIINNLTGGAAGTFVGSYTWSAAGQRIVTTGWYTAAGDGIYTLNATDLSTLSNTSTIGAVTF